MAKVTITKKKAPSIEVPDTEEAEDTASEPTAPASEPITVSVKKSANDLVGFIALRDINPSPVIGGCNVALEFDIPALYRNKSYRLPRGVVAVLVDAGAAAETK